MISNSAKFNTYGVLDIGSNSVRALVYADGKILYKNLITTRLGSGIALSNTLSEVSMDRTADAIVKLYSDCLCFGAEKVYAFATEAVRSSTNGDAFVSRVKNAADLDI